MIYKRNPELLLGLQIIWCPIWYIIQCHKQHSQTELLVFPPKFSLSHLFCLSKWWHHASPHFPTPSSNCSASLCSSIPKTPCRYYHVPPFLAWTTTVTFQLEVTSVTSLFPLQFIHITKVYFINCKDYFFFKKRSSFILREREREHKMGRGRERGRENPKQVLHCWLRARRGDQSHEPWDHHVSQNQESGTQPTEATQTPL